MPLDLVSQLMLRCDAKGKLLPPKLLKPGDQVTLTKGPFANFVAEVEKIAPDRRVCVLRSESAAGKLSLEGLFHPVQVLARRLNVQRKLPCLRK